MSKRTFNLSEDISQYLDTIPNNKKSKFVSQALMAAIEKAKKKHF